MRLLLDTHIFLGIIERRLGRFGNAIESLLQSSDVELHLSVTSLWEIAIKFRLGKLPLSVGLAELPQVAERSGIGILQIAVAHVIAELGHAPPTNDPFDRLLLAQCQVEGLRLVTVDRALIGHPLAAPSR